MNNVNPIVLELLAMRGITGDSEVAEFIAEKPKKTYDPFLLPDMEAGVDLILDAISQKKKICIYGDYDADGVTSVSILMGFLSEMTDNLEYYIPNRIEEGYGLNKEAIRKIHEGGTGLIITVDCGSVSYDEVELAKELGMQVLVTDHHSITDVKADCLMINPKRQDCTYPFRDLAGCGVAFKLTQAMQKKTGLPKSVMNRGLDMVALGTIADVVPLLDENRTLVKHGMNIISSGYRPGLASLIKGISFDLKNLRSDNIAFGVAPHINAAGRMGDAKVAANLMMEKNQSDINTHVQRLIEFNRERKRIQDKAFEECVAVIEEKYLNEPVIVLLNDDIHEGIAGIVAGKLKEKYQRPVIIVTPSGENFKGTGRSVPGVHLYELLHQYEELFVRFGGHAGACGFTIEPGKYGTLCESLTAEMNRRLELDPGLLEIPVDAELILEGSEVTLDLAKDLELLAPFGSHNPKPLFGLAQVEIKKIIPMGNGTHARFTAVCEDGVSVDCVIFGKAQDFEEELYGGIPVDLIGTVDHKEWRGSEQVQFTVESIL